MCITSYLRDFFISLYLICCFERLTWIKRESFDKKKVFEQIKSVIMNFTPISTEQLKRVHCNARFSDNVIVFYQITSTFKSFAGLHDVNFNNLHVN